ncbi:YaaL family protein [Virgibacillus sp. NKC19-3]|uniref:YaaL family protein n=1 Tax=Virgibacillus saliphilus TaxID=2831674 RepID=UPI001C9A55A8|nr:YaaL family protein [Virgibacillus sp. NKC19-3]MBY7141571.1 YaaL family protein [Virgibacillus sp. NKC19-3]
MANINKTDVDGELLDAIFALEREWKQIESIVDKSIESPYTSHRLEALAQAKYMFLLREARHRKISALHRV